MGNQATRVNNRDIVVFGGFSFSGHDTLLNVIADEIESRKIAGVKRVVWRELKAGVERHPIFGLHRRGMDVNLLSGYMDLPDIPLLLAEDLFDRTEFLLNVDAVVSVHPWTSIVLAEAALRRGADDLLIFDVAGDFTHTPVLPHDRVDMYLGGIGARPLSAKVRRKVHATGVPARYSDSTRGSYVDGRLYVAFGRTGYAHKSALVSLMQVVGALRPAEIVIASAGNTKAEREFIESLRDVAVISVPSGDDVIPWINSAQWILTKASGASISEALASNATVIAYESGVFWEDDSLRYLYAAGAVLTVDAIVANPLASAPRRDSWRQTAQQSAKITVDTIANRLGKEPREPDVDGRSVYVGMDAEIRVMLPALSAWMDESLPRWVSPQD